ncbi:hypothetical protein LCGC14_2002830 [marine sediment metagenome]|uniref:Uncharacterized protein n=1 Tax=marine sediment metagenome TaxID=412755 RepID=A0A0F9F2N6_9ZZZZ
MSDPKSTLLNVVDGITTTKDDNVTAAAIIFQYSKGPETLKSLFDDYDVIVTFHDSTTRPTRHLQDVPTYYPANLPVHVITIDKFNAAGVRVCTGTKMQWKMKAAMRTIIADNAQVGAYTLRILDERANDQWTVGLQVFEQIYIVEHKEA